MKPRMDADPLADAYFLLLLIHHFTGGSDPFNPWSGTERPAAGAERSSCAPGLSPGPAPLSPAPHRPGTGDGWSVRGDESAPVSLRPHRGFRREDRGALPSSHHHPTIIPPSSCLKYSSYFRKEGCVVEMWDVGGGIGDAVGFYLGFFFIIII